MQTLILIVLWLLFFICILYLSFYVYEIQNANTKRKQHKYTTIVYKSNNQTTLKIATQALIDYLLSKNRTKSFNFFLCFQLVLVVFSF